MQRKTKRLLVASVLMAFFVMIGCTAWMVVQVVAWARDLPNRIEIEFDGQAFGQFITGSIAVSLRAEDPQTQLQTIAYLTECLESNPDVEPWVRDSFRDEIEQLAKSDDANLAAAATVLLGRLNLGDEVPIDVDAVLFDSTLPSKAP